MQSKYLSAACLTLAVSLASPSAHADAGKASVAARAKSLVAQVKDHVEAAQGITRLALIGDLPYRDTDIAKLDAVIREINDSSVDITLHTGDIKSGSSLCSDDLFQLRFSQLAQLVRPLVYTPGDNEWTDCHRPAAGGYQPLERLAKIRALFFPKPGVSLGKRPMRVTTQASDARYAEFVENVRFERGDVVYATLHVVGSNNNAALWAGVGETAAAPSTARQAELARRIDATLSWIDATFDEAESRGAAAVLFSMQANPAFEAAVGSADRLGFDAIVQKLSARSSAFARPVMVAHGDSHYFRLDKPLLAATLSEGLRTLEDLSRVENFGDTNVHWVELVVDARTPEVFRVIPHVVEENRFAR